MKRLRSSACFKLAWVRSSRRRRRRSHKLLAAAIIVGTVALLAGGTEVAYANVKSRAELLQALRHGQLQMGVLPREQTLHRLI